MKTFFDTSAFAKRYVDEPGSDAVEDICMSSSALVLSTICLPEIISAMNRRVRENAMTRPQYTTIKKHLSSDLRHIEIINLTSEVITTTITLLEASPLRAMDALHIACAVACGADLFVTSDHWQSDAAKRAGLETRCI
ncbi:MAG: type II toxin-antitoxin system VapC family toxin [Pseudomonadota bacterium]